MTQRKLTPIGLYALNILARLHTQRALEDQIGQLDKSEEKQSDSDSKRDHKHDCDVFA